MQTKRELLSTGILLSLICPALSLAQETSAPPAPPWPGHWHMWSGMWGLGWFCVMLMLLLIAICAVGFYVGRGVGGEHHHWRAPWHRSAGHPWGDPTYTALQILNERFAKGEIAKQEYEEKRAAIRASSHS